MADNQEQIMLQKIGRPIPLEGDEEKHLAVTECVHSLVE
jgi:hypothetical protein